MKKSLIIYFVLSLFIFSNCKQEETQPDSDPIAKTIRIKTTLNQYQANDFIDIVITNELDSLATGFMCDNHYLPPFAIAKQTSSAWNVQAYDVWCTFMGPTGYLAELEAEETVTYENAIVDPSMFNNESEGVYKFKYKFIFESDTAFYYSNEFRILD